MRFFVLVLFLVLAGCAEPVSRQASTLSDQLGPARILAMGDSLMSWNRTQGSSISDHVERLLNAPVIDRSIPAAVVMRGLPGLNISQQYVAGPWDWVILNGGGNDLLLGCGCAICSRRLDRMVSVSGSAGAIPELVGQIRETGAQVIYVGYLRSPGRGSPIEHCRNEGNALETRIARMAAGDPGVHFVSIADLVPYGDLSFHAVDRIHPSQKASAAIASRVVSVMQREPVRR